MNGLACPRYGLSASVCGRRAGKWSGDGEERLTKRSRSATPAAEPQTEARRSCGILRMLARDERAVCEAEGAWSRGGKGRPKAHGAKQTVRWSRRNRQFARRSGSQYTQCGFINAGPTTHFSMRIFTVIARVSVRIQPSVFERFDNLHFFDGNTSVGQASDGSPRQTIFSNVGVYLSNDTLIGNGNNSKCQQ